jgi:cyclophilin family peptidyl-prolyl cis-trans isomerase
MSRKTEVDAAVTDLDFENKNYQVNLATTHGNVLLDLFLDVAPEHCKNLIGLTKIGYYDGLTFHRVINGFMIQGGCPEGTGTGGPGYTIPAEFSKTPHVNGTLSMARTNEPDTAGSQFFICLGTQDFLDEKYTAFGQAADEESLATIHKIGDISTDDNDLPDEPVAIAKATVIES